MINGTRKGGDPEVMRTAFFNSRLRGALIDASNTEGEIDLYWKAADGGSPAERLTTSEDAWFPNSIGTAAAGADRLTHARPFLARSRRIGPE